MAGIDTKNADATVAALQVPGSQRTHWWHQC